MASETSGITAASGPLRGSTEMGETLDSDGNMPESVKLDTAVST